MANHTTKAKQSTKTIKAILNGLEITFDADTGSIVNLYYPGPGQMLHVDPKQATIIDIAYPVPDFEPLRLASRFSHNARITATDAKVTVQWDRLDPSRSCFKQPGNVSATVIFDALPDGESILMSCEVENKSDVTVRQVIFPDFSGLLPFAGETTTIFKTGGFAISPFPELRMNEAKLSEQFCLDHAYGAVEYKPGGIWGTNEKVCPGKSTWMRWIDFGGLEGGFSIFSKQWGWDTFIPIRLHHFETEEKLRMLFVNDVEIKTGGKWKSCEFVLTPHKYGWAKGIEPYRIWATEHVKRKYPVPKHVLDGLGFRTIWMSQGFPKDPCDGIWKFSDLPALAKESKEHGLNEMVLWAWHKGFELPLPKPASNVGTEDEFARVVKDCKKIGVNVSPFISVVQAGESTASKYGLTVPKTNGWQQHTDTIPRFQPPYSNLYRCAQVDLGIPLWQKEVLQSCKRLIDSGIISLSWDQFWSTPAGEIYTVTSKIRTMAKKIDPESTFSAESLWNIELDCDYLDYTWNWMGYSDCQAYTSVFQGQGPRINCIVSDSPEIAKRGFLDNRYLLIMPRKAGSVNGSDWIINHKPLSKTLKQLAKLRKKFLSYFTQGMFIGNCLLCKWCHDAHVSSYILPERVLLMVMNLSGLDKKITFQCGLEPWIASPSGKYTVHVYDMNGKLVKTTRISNSKWKASTGKLKNLDITMYEISTDKDT